MHDDLDPSDELASRLRDLGRFPVDSATQSRHLTAMAEAAAAPPLLASLGSRLRVAGALLVGFMLGTTGLASAGALGPLQPIAASAIEAATPFDVPEGDAGTERFRGGDGETCDDSVEYRNRGGYLKAIRDKYGKDSAELEAAKATDCGKPLVSRNGDDESDELDSQEQESDESGKPEKEPKSADAGATGAEKSDAACAGGTGNGTEPIEPAAGEGEDNEAPEVTPTTGKPDCADEQKEANADRAADAQDAAEDKRPADAGPPADAGDDSDDDDSDDEETTED